MSLIQQPGEVVIDQFQTFFHGAGLSQVGTHLEIFLHAQVLKDPAALDDLDDPLFGDICRPLVVNLLAFVNDGPIGHLAVFRLQKP